MKLILNKIWSYLSFQKQASSADKGKKDFNLKMMHGINRISIIVFLIGIIFVLVKVLSK